MGSYDPFLCMTRRGQAIRSVCTPWLRSESFAAPWLNASLPFPPRTHSRLVPCSPARRPWLPIPSFSSCWRRRRSSTCGALPCLVRHSPCLLRGCDCVALTRSPLRVLSFRRRVWLRVDGYVVVAMCATLAAHRKAQCVVSLICCICCFTGGFQYFFYARLLTSLFPRTSCSRLVVGCGGAGCGCFEGLGLTHNCAWLINDRSRCVRCQADAREVA